MEKWLISELGQEKYKMRLKELGVPESKECRNGGEMSKDIASSLRELLLAKYGTI